MNAANEYLSRLVAFSDGTSRRCPVCDGPIEQFDLYEKIEPQTYSLYIRPCNHRLGLWSGVPEWANEVEVFVHVITLQDQDTD